MSLIAVKTCPICGGRVEIRWIGKTIILRCIEPQEKFTKRRLRPAV